MKFLTSSLTRAFKISSVGITLGAVAGLSCLIAGDGVPATAFLSGLVFWGLAVLPTATLLVMAMNDLQDQEYAMYISVTSAYGMLLMANVMGTVLASVFFYVLATNTPVLLKGLEPNALRQAVGQQIGGTSLAIVIVAAVIGAVAVAAWTHRRALT